MTQETIKKRTTGNFTEMDHPFFPLDCDGMQDMQANESLLAALGNIGGEAYILSEPGTDKGGYIFLRTTEEPDGELLYIEPINGTGEEYFYIHKENISIEAQHTSYRDAYSQRWLKWGRGNGSQEYKYEDFKKLKLQTNKQLEERCNQTNEELETRCNNINTRIDELSTFVKGMIIMWSGTDVPAGWALCDGQITKNGTETPDLRGRFVVGLDPRDSEYSPIRKTGGSASVSLSLKTIPNHSHSIQHTHSLNNHTHSITSGGSHIHPATIPIYKDKLSLQVGDNDNGIRSGNSINSISFNTGSAGSHNHGGSTGGVTGNTGNVSGGYGGYSGPSGESQAHENRPPYYVLAYIIKD